MHAATAETARVGELVEAVESDVGLAIAVLRFANRAGGTGNAAGTSPEAVEVLKPSGVLAIAGTAPVFDFFEPNGAARCAPSASASTPSPRSRPPMRSAARSAGTIATNSPSPPCSTTSAGW